MNLVTWDHVRRHPKLKKVKPTDLRVCVFFWRGVVWGVKWPFCKKNAHLKKIAEGDFLGGYLGHRTFVFLADVPNCFADEPPDPPRYPLKKIFAFGDFLQMNHLTPFLTNNLFNKPRRAENLQVERFPSF